MALSSSHRITQLLIGWNTGDQSSLEQLVSLVHAERHRLAAQYMRKDLANSECVNDVMALFGVNDVLALNA